jgi:phytoene/squalene synthetase
VAEDHRAGRRYLPGEDLRRFGVTPSDLAADRPAPQLRALVRFELERAERLLRDGAALVGELRGGARLAVAGYVAGGLAALTALRRAGWSVLPTHPPRRRRDVVRALTSLWLRPPRPGSARHGRRAVRLEEVS